MRLRGAPTSGRKNESLMAKKKRKAPTKKCVGCDKQIAAATRNCPHCQAVNESKNAKKKAGRRKGAKKQTAPAAASRNGSDGLELAIKFVEQVGSFRSAKAALAKIEKIKSL